MALAFHAWSGAAEALEDGAEGRSVAVEFGSLAVLGIVVAVLLHATSGPAVRPRVDTPRARCYNKAPSGPDGSREAPTPTHEVPYGDADRR